MANKTAVSAPPLPPWGSALAGATGAVLANAVVYPLDMVKTRLQVQVAHKPREPPPPSVFAHTTPIPFAAAAAPTDPHYASTLDALRQIAAEDGAAGLFAGMPGALLGVASTNFAYFYWYSVARALYAARTASGPMGARPSAAAELALGAAAGAAAQVCTLPVAVITTRQQTRPRGERAAGLLATGRAVVAGADGWTGLWRGLKASLVLVVNPAITYGAYERLRATAFRGKARLRPWEAFVLGAASKALATIVTQPLIVAKVGLQSRPPAARKGKPFKTFPEVMRYIIEHEGLPALFKGIGPQIMKGLLVQGLLMMTKERMEILFVLLFAYVRRLRDARLQKAASAAGSNLKGIMPMVSR